MKNPERAPRLKVRRQLHAAVNAKQAKKPTRVESSLAAESRSSPAMLKSHPRVKFAPSLSQPTSDTRPSLMGHSCLSTFFTHTWILIVRVMMTVAACTEPELPIESHCSRECETSSGIFYASLARKLFGQVPEARHTELNQTLITNFGLSAFFY